jgi:uncharacterized protein (DUF362 family)
LPQEGGDEVRKSMRKSIVSVVRYEEPLKSVQRAVELCHGLDHLPPKARVFIKPNIVLWTRAVPFPKWGVITTSRVVEDMVVVLKERGVDDITIGEGTASLNVKDVETPAHAFKTLGYRALKKRYGVKFINVFERPFEKVNLGDGIELNFNSDILHSDFVVDLPVLKTHSQTMVSLGIKNLKGTIDIRSRKKCHNGIPGMDLHKMVSRLHRPMPPMFTLLDGIYTNERGPNVDGRIKRSNIIVASADFLSADMVGAKVLGYDPKEVPHLAYTALDNDRPTDLSDVDVVGEPIEAVASFHKYLWPYNKEGTLPVAMARMGIKGLSYREYDLSICTYCAGLTRIVLMAIALAWKGKPWGGVEVLTGKEMKPTPGYKKTILLGKCMYQANKDNPHIQEMLAVKGCPPSPDEIFKVLRKAGIEVDKGFFEEVDKVPGMQMKKYEGKPEFDETFFTIT